MKACFYILTINVLIFGIKSNFLLDLLGCGGNNTEAT